MTLYKYLPSSRLDVILNSQIRFTPLGALNDPYELRPYMDRLAEKSRIQEHLEKNFPRLIGEACDDEDAIYGPIGKEDILRFAEERKPALYGFVEKAQSRVTRSLMGIFQAKCNELIGALSLSEAAGDQLMWSHYAEEHKGYVVGFNSEDPFFDQRVSPEDELRHLKRITYVAERPPLNLADSTATDLFFVKSNAWEYEAEWRILLPLSGASITNEAEFYPIHLFSFPPKAVSSVIIGMRMSDDDIFRIKSHLATSDHYSHVKIYRASLHDRSYEILLNEL